MIFKRFTESLLIWIINTIQHAALMVGIRGISGQSSVAGHLHKHVLDAAPEYIEDSM